VASTIESEWKSRKTRIDPKLDAAGWRLAPGNAAALHRPYRTEEEETDHGPADYTLWLDNHVVAVVEAKKLAVGPQGVRKSPYNFNGFRAPFLYATNGEVIWFHDVRDPLNRSRRIAAFPGLWAASIRRQV